MGCCVFMSHKQPPNPHRIPWFENFSRKPLMTPSYLIPRASSNPYMHSLVAIHAKLQCSFVLGFVFPQNQKSVISHIKLGFQRMNWHLAVQTPDMNYGTDTCEFTSLGFLENTKTQTKHTLYYQPEQIAQTWHQLSSTKDITGIPLVEKLVHLTCTSSPTSKSFVPPACKT